MAARLIAARVALSIAGAWFLAGADAFRAGGDDDGSEDGVLSLVQLGAVVAVSKSFPLSPSAEEVEAPEANSSDARASHWVEKHWRLLSARSAADQAGSSISRAVHGIHIPQSQQDVRLWPIPAKVCVALVLFVIFEYFMDCFPCCTLRAPPPERLPEKVAKDADADTDVDDDAGADGDSITVLSLNVWVNRARENAQKQIRAIRRLDPDVICLQEAFHLDVLAAYRTAFPEYTVIAFGKDHSMCALLALIGIMLSVATVFSTVLTLAEHYFDDRWKLAWLLAIPVECLIYVWLVRHHWTIVFLTGNRTGLVLLVRRSKFELDLRSKPCIAFSKLGQVDDFLNAFRPRGYIRVPGLMRRKHGPPLPVCIANTHLNQPLEQHAGIGRHHQVKEIIDNCVKDEELFILGCDLNATPPGTVSGSDCATYPDIVMSLSDSWEDSNPSDPNRDGLTWDQRENPMCTSVLNTLFYGRALRWRCDFIFWRYGALGTKLETNDRANDKSQVSKIQATGETSVSVRSCTMVFTGKEAVSDHFGVHTVFDIRSAEAMARHLPQAS